MVIHAHVLHNVLEFSVYLHFIVSLLYIRSRRCMYKPICYNAEQ